MGEAKEGIGRRDFLKLLGLGAGAAAVLWGAERIASSKEDLSTPENLEEFVGKEIQPAYFKGKVHVREGATIHNEPTYWSEDADRSLITTQKRRDTQIASVGMGESFIVNNPLLVFQEAMDGEGGVYIKEVTAPSGEKKLVDARGSWIVFGLGLSEDIPDNIKNDIKRTRQNVGCVNFQDLAFEPEGERIQFSFPQEAVEFRQEIDLGL
jgi:hypothetical protein